MRVGAEGAGDALMGESLAREGMGFSCRGKVRHVEFWWGYRNGRVMSTVEGTHKV